jgi:hypothetical protein
VDVEVHDRHAARPALRLEHARADRQVVQVAEALGLVGEGVVEPAAEMHRRAVLERLARRRDRAPARQHVGIHDLGRERQLGVERARRPPQLLEIVQVRGGVHALEVLARGRRRQRHVGRIQGALRDQGVAHQAVLHHREHVGSDVAGVVRRPDRRGHEAG